MLTVVKGACSLNIVEGDIECEPRTWWLGIEEKGLLARRKAVGVEKKVILRQSGHADGGQLFVYRVDKYVNGKRVSRYGEGAFSKQASSFKKLGAVGCVFHYLHVSHLYASL